VDFSGTYHVMSSPHFDDEYLHLTGTPYVTLRQDEDGRIKGEYEIGVQSGTLIGHAYSDFIDFTFGATTRWKKLSARARPRWTGIA
jgi:hypothetical protein